jgi:hypothetical protein
MEISTKIKILWYTDTLLQLILDILVGYTLYLVVIGANGVIFVYLFLAFMVLPVVKRKLAFRKL